MTFNSPAFLLFFPVVLLFHFLIPTKYRHIPQLILSYYFYACWNAKLMGLIMFTTVVSYFAGILIEKTQKKGQRRLLLAITLVACLGVLFFYKYFNFFASTVTSVISAFSGEVTTGAALDLKLLPSAVEGEDGLSALMALMRGFVILGGFFMQLDVADVSGLRDAQEHPEDYQTLSVRVSGWIARFVTLSREWQNMIIEQTER